VGGGSRRSRTLSLEDIEAENELAERLEKFEPATVGFGDRHALNPAEVVVGQTLEVDSRQTSRRPLPAQSG
jgi:hypothetical protein